MSFKPGSPITIPVREVSHTPTIGPGETVLPPSNAPAVISTGEIRQIGQSLYERGWGRTLPHGGRN